MVLSFFAKMILLQVVVFSLIIFILKMILDKKLIESAINEFRVWEQERRNVSSSTILVISYKPLKKKYKLKILKIALDYFGEGVQPSFKIDKALHGGLVIHIGEAMIECSLKDRLSQAFPSR